MTATLIRQEQTNVSMQLIYDFPVRLSPWTSNIVFADIPQTFKSLVFHIRTRSTRVATWDSLIATVNQDTGNNYYSYTNELSNASTVAGSPAASTLQGPPIVCWPSAASAPTNVFSTYVIDVIDYTNTVGAKAFNTHGHEFLATSAGGMYLLNGVFIHAPATSVAVNRVSFDFIYGDFDIGTRITLYGIK